MSPEAVPQSAVDAIRAFNRFYTRQIGLLNEGLLDSGFSLTQVRVLYELAHRDSPGATELGADLQLDPGYLSRLLCGFAARSLVRRLRSSTDGRQRILSLTPKGRRVIAPLEKRSSREIGAMLARVKPDDRSRLLAAMDTIEGLLANKPALPPAVPYILRPPQAGDFGWVAARHGWLYAREYGWDETFEALVAEIVAKFVREYDPKRERCWIAERDGAPAGSVFLVKESADVAKLRLLFVEPSARGLGIGRRLVEECIRFAQTAGYRKLTLWTNDVLVSARRIYEAAGFRLADQWTHHSFGKDLIGQTWERDLQPGSE